MSHMSEQSAIKDAEIDCERKELACEAMGSNGVCLRKYSNLPCYREDAERDDYWEMKHEP